MVAIFEDKVTSSFPLSRRCQRVSGVYVSFLCMRDLEKGGKLQSKWVRRDITWRDHSTEATMDELTLVIGEDYSDVVEWNVAS
jgi:hypothetical protein